jgi:hypothetical protein
MNPKSGETYFGSKEIWGAANRFDAQTFLTTRPAYDPAIGDPYSWLSWYLSRLYAFDLFVGNPDRQVCNFLLVQEGSKRRLWAFDFDAADLSLIKTSNFPIVQTKTLSVGRLWRQHRHFDESSAFELIDWLGAISTTALESILAPIPDDWMSSDKREAFVDDWRKGASAARLTALRCGLKDGSLL